MTAVRNAAGPADERRQGREEYAPARPGRNPAVGYFFSGTAGFAAITSIVILVAVMTPAASV
jgi:hypothetical protein